MSTPGTISECPSSPWRSVTPESQPDSNGVPTIFSTSPAMGHPSTIPRDLQSPHDSLALALDQLPRPIDAISTLTARGPSTPPYAINYLQSPQQLLEQREAKRRELLQTHVKELENKFNLQSQEHQERCHRHCDEWYERCENRAQEIREKSDEIATLIVEPSPQIIRTISN